MRSHRRFHRLIHSLSFRSGFGFSAVRVFVFIQLIADINITERFQLTDVVFNYHLADGRIDAQRHILRIRFIQLATLNQAMTTEQGEDFLEAGFVGNVLAGQVAVQT